MQHELTEKQVVCPHCGYGFFSTSATHHQCPYDDCGYEWEPFSGTLGDADESTGREAKPEIRIISGAEGSTYQIPEGVSVIGRDDSCSYKLDNLHVSRNHAQILRNSETCLIRDMGSRAGIAINGERLKGDHRLQIGDIILISGITLEYKVRFEAKQTSNRMVDSHAVLAKGKSVEVYHDGIPTDVISLKADKTSFGRDNMRDVYLNFATVSRRHAYIIKNNAGYELIDTKSSSGTFVNGKSIIRITLNKGDRVQIGPFLFIFEGKSLRRNFELDKMKIDVVKLIKDVPTARILDNVTFSIQPNEFVGLLGPSGAGKSTLMDALNGMRPATKGDVYFNDQRLYDSYELFRESIGYVPQDDIIHRELTVKRALTYAARLRLPADTSDSEIDDLVDEVVSMISLSERKQTVIASLSGGQRKRVSVGVELLSQPKILFLDEPTSGLDPGTESQMMKLFRQLADQGRTVICTTHVMENVDLFDKIIVLVKGKLAFCGQPRLALDHFRIAKITELYDKLDSKEPEHWESSFRKSPLRKLNIPNSAILKEKSRSISRNVPRTKPAPLGQAIILIQRFGEILTQDKRNLGILMGQAIVIASLICLVCNNASMIAFLAGISAIWFGCSNAATQIVKEWPVYARERMVNLSIIDYVISKMTILMAVAAVQCGVLYFFIVIFKGLSGSGMMQFLMLMLASLAGTTMGLCVSSFASNTDKANSLVPILLIPQLIFAGMLVAPRDMNTPTKFLSRLSISRWTHDGMASALLHGKIIPENLNEGGEFVVDYLGSLMMRFPDFNLRHQEGLISFIKEEGGTEINTLTCSWLDATVLLIFSLLHMLLTMFLLWRRDVIRRYLAKG